MSKLALAAAALLAGLPLAAANAAPLSGDEIRARSVGGEFRGYDPARRLREPYLALLTRLGVEWQGFNRQFSGCYAVDGSADSTQVRLIGPATWQGTLSHGNYGTRLNGVEVFGPGALTYSCRVQATSERWPP